MKKGLYLAALLLALAAPTEARKNKALTEKDMGAYLFTYFNDPTHALFMAISYDEYDMMSAATPDTCGQAIEVPCITPYLLSGSVL